MITPQKLTVETRFLPRIEYDFQDKTPSAWAKAMKPKITGRIGGRDMVLYAPYGDPGRSLFYVILGSSALALFSLGRFSKA